MTVKFKQFQKSCSTVKNYYIFISMVIVKDTWMVYMGFLDAYVGCCTDSLFYNVHLSEAAKHHAGEHRMTAFFGD